MAKPTDVPAVDKDSKERTGVARESAHGDDPAAEAGHAAPPAEAPAAAAPPTADAPAAEPSEPGTAPAASRSRGALGTVFGDARLAWALALLAIVAAVLFGVEAASLRAEASVRAEAREAGEIVAAQITTFDGTQMDAWVEGVQALSTSDFAEEVTGLFDQDFRAALAENAVQSVGEIQSSFVQELDGDEATLFILASQTSTNSARTEPVVDELRMEVVLERVDGRWLADEVAVLGPAGIAAPDAAGEQGQAPAAVPTAAPTVPPPASPPPVPAPAPPPPPPATDGAP